MNLLQNLSRRLGWKLFLSYLFVILVGFIVLAVAAEYYVPNAFDRHMARMMGSNGMMGMMGEVENNLFSGFQDAFNETLILAAVVAVVIAAIASYLVSRRIVAPVQAMMKASQRIAAGSYEERVGTQGRPGGEDELDQLARSFNSMAAQLEQTETMRRQLIGDVAHELRTPLTTIKGSLEGLIDDVLPADVSTYQQIYQEADRLGRLVNDLQELSRVESRAVVLDIRPVRIEAVIRGIASRMEPQFSDKHVSLQIDCPPGIKTVTADEDRLIQVITNLFGNALQYTPEGGAVRVLCEETERKRLVQRFSKYVNGISATGDWLVVSVLDSGIGIPPEHLPFVFDRFYRVDKSRSRAGGGSGIGLTIARHIVEAHGGKIWAESEGLEKGSVFRFCLPVV